MDARHTRKCYIYELIIKEIDVVNTQHFDNDVDFVYIDRNSTETEP